MKSQSYDMNILDEMVVYRNGSYVRKRRWIEGWHPALGQLIIGLSGKQETVQNLDVIIPMHVVMIKTPEKP